MNKLSIFIFGFAGSFLLFSCKDENAKPLITFEDVGKGAYPRNLGVESDVFDIRTTDRFGASSLKYKVEFVDLEKGGLVDAYNVYVKHNNGDEKLYKTFGPGDFGKSEGGFVSYDANIPANEILSLLGLALGDLSAGDNFNFRTELKLSDGKSYSSLNSTPSVAGDGSAFNAFFDPSALLTCPLADAEFTGNYAITYDAAPTGALGPIFGADAGTVALAPVDERGSTKRSFTITYLKDNADKATDLEVVLNFLCDHVEVDDIVLADDDKVCVGGETFTTVQGDVTSIDLNNQGSFKLNLIEFKKDGGCGYDQAPVTITFTKQ